MATNWQAVADRLAADQPGTYPSAHYRAHAVHVLTRVERIGPLGPADEEFRRVYTFLHYNEPADVRRVVRELFERASRPRSPLRVRNNAWKYTVAAYDQWYGHARIVYLAAGLVEGTLRSRLNERLTTVFGPDWVHDPEAVPSSVRDAPLLAKRAERMEKVEKRLAKIDPQSLDLAAARTLIAQMQQLARVAGPATASGPAAGSALAVPPGDVGMAGDGPQAAAGATADAPAGTTAAPPDGAAYLAKLTLHQLQAFFTTERLHGEPALLKELLRDRATGAPVPLSQIQKEFTPYRGARNDVAHYKLGAELSFTQSLFNAATIASWLGVDLQGFYGSVDARQSTELSRLLGPQLRDLVATSGHGAATCEEPGCVNEGPYDWMLTERAPCDRTDLTAGLPVRRACLVHRVAFRAAQHKHVGL